MVFSHSASAPGHWLGPLANTSPLPHRKGSHASPPTLYGRFLWYRRRLKYYLLFCRMMLTKPKPHQIGWRFHYIRNNLNEDLIDRSTERRGIEIGSTSEKRKKSTMSAEQKRILSISSCFFYSFRNSKNMTAAPRARESRSQTRRRKFIYIIYSGVNHFPWEKELEDLVRTMLWFQAYQTWNEVSDVYIYKNIKYYLYINMMRD